MSTRHLIFAYPGQEPLAKRLATWGGELAQVHVRAFPDGESYVRVMDEGVAGCEATIVCSLAQPDSVFLRLAMMAQTVRDLGARRVTLVAPYLSYMRQDERFHPGEGVTSVYFARLLSGLFDALITMEPHLHRWESLQEIYTIPTTCVSAAPALASWVRAHTRRPPVIIGPDAESRQWVDALARELDAPGVVFEKVRHGDRNVDVRVRQLESYLEHDAVILDDIISTGRTLACTVEPLVQMGFSAPTCLGVHAVFSDDAVGLLMKAGAKAVVTTNTIAHESNGVDIFGELASAWGAQSLA